MTTVYGGGQIRDAIKQMCDSAGVKYEYFEHEPVRTSEEAAQVRNSSLKEGAKALIFLKKNSQKHVQVVLSANLRVDKEKVTAVVNEPVKMASPDEINKRYGLEVGAVPPFGHVLGIEVLVDEKIFQNGQVSFNCGLRTASIVMPMKSFKKVIFGKIGDWSEQTV